MQLPAFQTTPDASVRGAEPRGRVQCLGGKFAGRRLGIRLFTIYKGMAEQTGGNELVQQQEAG
jgi:hypothetical protein